MKVLILFLATLLVTACSQQVSVVDKSVGFYKEAFLRTRHIYQIDRNIDQNNPAVLTFTKRFADQLIELNFTLNPMNTIFYSLINSDFVTSKKAKTLTSSDVKVYLDGIDITACLIEECNLTNCDGNSVNENKFSDGFNVNRIYLNLAKLDKSSSTSCLGFDLNDLGVHSLRFEEQPVASPNFSGGRLQAQVLVYNRTDAPENILNLLGSK